MEGSVAQLDPPEADPHVEPPEEDSQLVPLDEVLCSGLLLDFDMSSP